MTSGGPEPGENRAVHAIAADAALVGAARRRLHDTLAADRGSGLFVGVSFLVVAGGWLVLARPPWAPIGLLSICVAAFAVASCVEFEIGPGCAVPTAPVQVVMLFVLPAPLVPVAVFVGLVAGSRIARLWDPARKERTLVLAGSGWQIVGPAAVFALAHVGRPAVSDWPVYALALLAQFSLDAASSWVRNCYGLGVATRQLADALQFTFLCDVCLAPVGFACALALPHSSGALILLSPLILLLAALQSDRSKHIDDTIALGAAFSNTNDLARRDALTGVANRLAFEEATARHQQTETPVGVILADVDGLKAANDTHGHAMGDRLLIAVAEQLANAAATIGAPVFRIGGDEFVVLLTNASSDASVRAVAHSIQVAFRDSPAIDSTIPISASVGTGFAPAGQPLGPAIAAADREVNTNKSERGVRRHDRTLAATDTP